MGVWLFEETHAIASTSRLRERQGLRERERGDSSGLESSGNGFDDVYDRNETRAEFLGALSAGGRLWGRVSNIVDC